jgi:hypothetical protein
MSGRLPQGPTSEKGWQSTVLDIAKLGGWRTYHTFDSRRSTAGYPDLTLTRPPELIFAELKAEKGRTAPEQEAWLEDLQVVAEWSNSGVGEVVRVYLWRPSDFDEVRRVLLERRS